MHTIRVVLVITAALMSAASAVAQEWVRAYEQGLRHAKQGEWIEARERFLAAIANRPEDTDRGSQTGGAITDRRPWRQGAPYTPNFGAAYAAFKIAAEAADPETRSANLELAINGFNSLIAQGKESQEVYLFLAAAHAARNETRLASQAQERLNTLDPATAFRIDREIIELGDLRALQGIAGPAGPGTPITLRPDQMPQIGVGTRHGLVPIIENKFALLIGNSAGSGQSFAENDVELLKETLVRHAGYAEGNIVVVTNATAGEIMGQAAALAERMPENATVFVFFSGAGVYDATSGRDYLAGVDNSDRTNHSAMVGKTSLYQVFLNKAATIFAFFQADRPMANDGTYFGMEIPQVGRIAQSQGASPGERTYGTVRDGRMFGVYTQAMSEVLSEMRNNRVAIVDFAWQTFYRVREGVGDGGGGSQTPTLPVVVSMTTTARF